MRIITSRTVDVSTLLRETRFSLQTKPRRLFLAAHSVSAFVCLRVERAGNSPWWWWPPRCGSPCRSYRWAEAVSPGSAPACQRRSSSRSAGESRTCNWVCVLAFLFACFFVFVFKVAHQIIHNGRAETFWTSSDQQLIGFIYLIYLNLKTK